MFPDIAGNETVLKAAVALQKKWELVVYSSAPPFLCAKAAQDLLLQNFYFHVPLVFLLLVAALIEVRIPNDALVLLTIIAFFAVLGLASLFVFNRDLEEYLLRFYIK